jgi:hypothetical protein
MTNVYCSSSVTESFAGKEMKKGRNGEMNGIKKEQ